LDISSIDFASIITPLSSHLHEMCEAMRVKFRRERRVRKGRRAKFKNLRWKRFLLYWRRILIGINEKRRMHSRASFPFLRLPAMLLSSREDGKSLNVILRIDLGFDRKKI